MFVLITAWILSKPEISVLPDEPVACKFPVKSVEFVELGTQIAPSAGADGRNRPLLLIGRYAQRPCAAINDATFCSDRANA